ncbi:glycosyltransferase [Nodosilinea sp. PGN35]|uniref:glycosyltransferase n=1 Tax=Nodosilinea sp. PGN35 TaxID=3020489 RepID=UPI0023B33004|nr:glycosyltransferase family 2 protein [Nodosilinea sp. TSF1-S3]MDF0367323.1 glycosyltransferase family 2 protein [Nodosilinea sp. TSF1-S3]
MASPTQPHISIVIPVYNGGPAFKTCLQSLELFLPAPDDIRTEVIVVADGCTDGSDHLAEKFGATLLKTSAPGGPARARNLGARQARGEILFFIDADVTIQSDTLRQVASLFAQEPQLAAAIGSYDDAPGAANFLSQYKNLFHHYTHQTSRTDASTFWGACGAIRRDIFWAVGGFDEQYHRPSIEDIELGYRLKQHGYTIRLCKTLHVKHLKRWEPLSLLRAEFFYRALPWSDLLLKQGKMTNDLNLKRSTRLSVVLVFAILVLLPAGYWWSAGVGLAGLLALVLIALNFSVYRFFYQKRGLWFTLRMLPWHWLYFAYSGLAYGIGFCRFYLLPQRFSTLIP